MIARVWLARALSLFRQTRLERELERDVQEHLNMAAGENERRGMSPAEARNAALRSFGGAELMKEQFRDQRGIPALETCIREIRMACRSLRRAPGFSLLAILTLAVAIGANSAIFSAVNALLFRPAGISDASRVVVIRAKYDKLNLKDLVVSLDDFEAAGKNEGVFSAVAIAKTYGFAYTGGASPQVLTALRVSSQWFDVFGAPPAQGRIFTREEDQPDRNRVVVLSDAAWKRVFGGDPAIVGKSIDLDQIPYKVIGVMRPEYSIATNELGGLRAGSQDLFVPLAARAESPGIRYSETYLAVARLSPGVTLARARAFMGVLTARGFEDRLAGTLRKNNGWGLFLIPYTDFLGGDMKVRVLILWGAAGLVLLIACANIAGLTMARNSVRSREFAVRNALGGSRWHLLRQLSTEALILALGGSAAGLGVAYIFMRGVTIWGPESVVGALKIPFDPAVVIFTGAAGLLSGVLFGIAPACRLGRRAFNAGESLKESGRSSTAGRERTRLRAVLATAEVALAVVLAIGAGLLLRSLSRLEAVDPGFRAEGVMSAVVALPESRYKTPERQLAFYRDAIAHLAAIPGVRSAAVAYPAPFGPGYESRGFQITGRPYVPNQPLPLASVRLVTPEFFSTLRIPLKRGRGFTAQDVLSSEKVTVIDETLARQYWPNEDPLGQHVILQSGLDARVVGVVGHIKESDLGSSSDQGVLYYSFLQQPIVLATFLLEASGSAAGLAGEIRQAVNAVDRALPVFDASTMEERIAATLAGRRFTIALLAMFAIAAVLLAALGLYGVINYGVTRRTQEIGIRVALGAGRGQVLRLVAGQGARITLIGLALGWMAAYAIARLLPGQLFGVSAFDPATFAAMAILLAAVTFAASFIPARRAMNLDPVEACRYE